jgi:hypothetical protein
LPASADLTASIRREAMSYLATLSAFCTAGKDAVRGVDAGIAGKWAHILRDCRRDLASGLINIPQEDVAAYKLEPLGREDLWFSPSICSWVAAKCRAAQTGFESGFADAQRHPSTAYRVMVSLLCAKYRTYLWLIRRNHYELQLTYRWSVAACIRFVVDAVTLCTRSVFSGTSSDGI